MADFEKVYSVKIDTTKAIAGFKALDKFAGSLDAKLKRLNKTSLITTKRFNLMGRFIGDAAKNTKSLSAGLSKTNRKMKEASSNMSHLNKRTGKLKKGMSSVGLKYKAAGLAAVAFAGSAIKSNIKLNESMANVQTLLTGGTEQTERLKQGIQSMAMETGKPAEDLAEGLYEVVSALGESTDNMNQLGVAARAGIAGRSSTIEAVKLLSAVTKGYGDVSSEAQKKTSDLAFQTVKLGQTTFPQLAASIGRVVPTSAALNVSQEEMFATMATLTGVTGDAAEVTTQLSSVYSAFLKPRAELTKLAKKEGFDTAAQMLKNKGLAATLDILKKKTKGNIDEIAKLIPRKEGQLALVALLGEQYDTYNGKLEEMRRSSGATDKAFAAQTKGINAQGQAWKRATQTVDVFSQKLGDSLAPALQGVLDIMIPLVETLSGVAQLKTLEEQEKVSDESFDARGIAKRGTVAQKQDALGKALARRDKLKKESITGEGGSVFESAAWLIGASYESPMEKRKRLYAENERAISQLQAGVAADKSWSALGGGMTAYNKSLAGSGSSATTNNNNVTINLQGVQDKEANAQAIKRVLSKDLSSSGKSIGSG